MKLSCVAFITVTEISSVLREGANGPEPTFVNVVFAAMQLPGSDLSSASQKSPWSVASLRVLG
jgi:hypothetical protein